MSVFNKILARSTLAISILFAFLTACSGAGSSDPTVVMADFSAYGVKGTVNGQSITLDLTGLGNCATSIENMVIGINANGASISPDPRTARDYTKPVQFTLTAPDGTKVVYTVTVKGAECLTPSTPPVIPPIFASCAAAAIGSTGYSLVFKGCNAANVAEYYEKTECVRDNATGLIWQGQTPAGTGLRANDQNKTNYDSTTALQKPTIDGTTTRYIPPAQTDIDAITNSIGYKNAVNATDLCGSSAWRLPTKDELLSIVKTGARAPALDLVWFPNASPNQLYWSSSQYPEYSYYAYYVDFYFGEVGGAVRGYGDESFLSMPVRLVR